MSNEYDLQIECKYCSRVWNGHAQCDCFGWVESQETEESPKPVKQRNYIYPSKMIRKKDGRLKRNCLKQARLWRQDIQKNHQSIELYNQLKLENIWLKDQIQQYKSALETWIQLAQTK